jgi:hypothetical protein
MQALRRSTFLPGDTIAAMCSRFALVVMVTLFLGTCGGDDAGVTTACLSGDSFPSGFIEYCFPDRT